MLCPIFWRYVHRARTKAQGDHPSFLLHFEDDQYGKDPIPTRGGGSIPIIALFEKELGIKTMLMGFGLDSDDIHSPDEHYGLFNYYKGIETIPWFYHYFAQMHQG
jgi:acetylornithine deacetylase/succinyl-diaminopimelate desuccinylase-like protein